MLAKLIAGGETREAAIARAVAALRAFPILGVRTNVAVPASGLLEHPAFRAGDLHTGFVDEHLRSLLARPEPSEIVLAVASAARSSRDAAIRCAPSTATGERSQRPVVATRGLGTLMANVARGPAPGELAGARRRSAWRRPTRSSSGDTTWVFHDGTVYEIGAPRRVPQGPSRRGTLTAN